MIETEAALRAKMLYYLGHAKNALRRRGIFMATAILYAESGVTEWDMNIDGDRLQNRAQQRAKLENIVLCERPYCIFFIGDTWVSTNVGDGPRQYRVPRLDPDREEVVLCEGTLRHPHLDLMVSLSYDRDGRGRPVFTGAPRWYSTTDPDQQLIASRWFRDIWSMLK